MGLLDMLLGGHHGVRRQGGHHDDDDHHRRRHDYGHGWGHSGGFPERCNNGMPSGSSEGARPGDFSETAICPSCQTLNGNGARFCQQCGTSMLPGKCTHCNATVPGGTKFCGQCGKACG